MAFLMMYGGLFLRGLVVTLGIWLAAAVTSTFCGIILGVLSTLPTRLGHFACPFIQCFIFLWRGVPLYVQLLITYFVLPEIIGINLSPLSSSIIALSVCSSAYMTAIIRSGIAAVSRGQHDAALSLGFTQWQAMYYVIIPQALRIVAPIIVNEYEALVKSTALLSVLGVAELTKVGKNIIAQHFNPVPVWGFIVLLYLLLSGILTIIASLLRSRLTYEE